MAISLYETSVPSFLQTLNAVSGFLDKGLKHLRENSVDPEGIVETRVYPDMLPFRFQIQSVVHHSLGALEGIMSGIFRPPGEQPAHDYAALQALVASAREAVGNVSPEALNAREGAEVIFELRGNRLPFTAEKFLLSFSVPNFYFHATTAYDILRSKGVPLGKRDYLGALRMNK
jgi:uncharacterized protein